MQRPRQGNGRGASRLSRSVPGALCCRLPAASPVRARRRCSGRRRCGPRGASRPRHFGPGRRSRLARSTPLRRRLTLRPVGLLTSQVGLGGTAAGQQACSDPCRQDHIEAVPQRPGAPGSPSAQHSSLLLVTPWSVSGPTSSGMAALPCSQCLDRHSPFGWAAWLSRGRL